MALHYEGFDKRLKNIMRNHEVANKRGVVRVVTEDGLMIAKPRAMRPQFPLRSLLVLIVVGFTFKGLVFAALGAEAYGEKLAALQTGSAIEQAGAWIMQPDPATLLLADGFAPFLR